MKGFIAVLVIALVCAMSTDVDAGGKNSKNGKIVVRNNTTMQVGVAVDPSNALQAAMTPAQFTAAGGFILNPGESRTFNVRSGNHTVIRGTNVADFRQRNVNVSGGQTVNLNVTQINDFAG